MSGRKETRPSAATLRRAAENGNAYETDRLSAENETMYAVPASSSSSVKG